MMVRKSAYNVDATEESDLDDYEVKDPLKDVFLNKLTAMNEKV